jgi:hypothetical protein
MPILINFIQTFAASELLLKCLKVYKLKSKLPIQLFNISTIQQYFYSLFTYTITFAITLRNKNNKYFNEYQESST